VPAAPHWVEQDLAERGGQFAAVTETEPKAQHGRREVRMLWVLADPEINAYAGSAGSVGKPWPHLAQICRVERRRTQCAHGQETTEVEVSYAITSRGPARADASSLLRDLRGHWGIENKVHWVRDVTWDEDRSQVRTGAAPQVMAACRNIALNLLRRRGVTNVAAALRTYAGRPAVAVHLVLSGGLT
jgi:predicted transposase YbfD/YdcC